MEEQKTLSKYLIEWVDNFPARMYCHTFGELQDQIEHLENIGIYEWNITGIMTDGTKVSIPFVS